MLEKCDHWVHLQREKQKAAEGGEAVEVVVHLGVLPESHGDLLSCLQLQNDGVRSGVKKVLDDVPNLSNGGVVIARDHDRTVLGKNGATYDVVEANRAEAEVVDALHRSSEWTYERRGAVNEPMKGEGKYKSSECIYERRGEL